MAVKTGNAPTRDLKLEVVIIPVADVERAKRFYGGLGWRLDADFAGADDFRVIQLASTRSVSVRGTRTGPTGTRNT
jgi:catechol 2,3-dioxygenase-like lactoylglutathione lyase family enzyme